MVRPGLHIHKVESNNWAGRLTSVKSIAVYRCWIDPLSLPKEWVSKSHDRQTDREKNKVKAQGISIRCPKI
eukprot:4238227-Ditylum_brightwellii.AAC.1